MRPSRRGLLTAAALAAAAPASTLATDTFAASAEPGEFIGPLAGWADARRDFGAVGDGKADDTAALQRALDTLHDEKTTTTALYLPAGTYRITRTLTLPRSQGRQAIGLNIQGEDPARTVIRWDGEAGGVMLLYGPWYSKIGRITLDGAGRAAVALRHGPEFVTANEIADMVFRDVGFGIEAGDWKAAGTAETSIQRCRFLRCSQAGASLLNFNSLDLWFWHCQFEDCRVGLTNVLGAGNFYAYHCLFRRSTEADISIRNTGYFSFRDNTSIGSRTFFVATPVVAGALLTFQRNRIFDTTDPVAIRVDNLGPVVLLDNVIASRAGAVGPVVVGPAALVSVGNRYTAEAPLIAKPGLVRLDDVSVKRASLRATAPNMPSTPRRFEGRIVELAAPVDAATIQTAVDAAAKTGRPTVIHLPAGNHRIDRTIVVPAQRDLRLVGEGMPYQTQLQGSGVGSVLRLLGPSRASLRDLTLVGDGRVDGLIVEGCDGAGASVWMDQVQVAGASEAGYLIDPLKSAAVRLRDAAHSGCEIGIRVVGAGEGLPTARVAILSGASSDNALSYQVEAGARLLARDIWYETGSRHRFMRLTGAGEFTLNGSNIALVRSAEEPAVEIAGFRGKVAFLGVTFSRVGGEPGLPQVVVTSAEPATQVLLLACHGNEDYLAVRASAGRTVRADSIEFTPGGGAKPIGDVGVLDGTWLREMLAAARDPVSGAAPMGSPAGLTDVRLHRVFIRSTRIGVHLRA